MPEIILPGGAVVETDTTIDGMTDPGGPVRFHAEQADSRLVETWKLPNMKALLRTYAEEADECERMLWDVLVSRLLDYATGYTLDLFGRLLNVARGAREDDPYRARLRVQIRIYQSFGRSVDIIDVLRLLDPAAFTFRQGGTAYYTITYTEPLTVPEVAAELPEVLLGATALGVGFSVGIVYANPILFDGAGFTSDSLARLSGTNYTGGSASTYRRFDE